MAEAVEGHLARESADIATRQVQAELATQSLGTLPGVQARLEQMQLCLAHRAFETQQKAVVEVARVVDAIGVGDEGVEQGADLEQLVPIAAGAGEPRHLDAEDQPDMAEANLGHQTLEAGPVGGGRPRAAEIVVDHQHLPARPAELAGAFDKRVLQPDRLAVLLDLTWRRL